MIARGYELKIVSRYLSSRRRDGSISVTALLSIIAISLGVAALIVVMSVMNGFRAELLDKILGYHGHILVQGYGGQIKDYQAIIDDLSGAPDVTKITAFTENQVMVSRQGRGWGAVVRGLPEELFAENAFPVKRVISGNVENALETGGVVLGYQLARRLGVSAGGEVTLISAKPVDTPLGSTLRYLNFPVEAVVEIGVYQFDESFIGMPLEDAQTFFRLGDTVSNIEVFLKNPDTVEAAMPRVEQIVSDRAYASGWKSYNQALVGALQAEEVAMFIVLSLIILVAVFNISSSLFMLVKDKSSDIAILRTMGMDSAGIRRVFVTLGLSVGLMGIAAGGVLAALIIVNLESIKTGIEAMLGLDLWDPSVRIITEMKAVVEVREVVMTIGVAVLLSFVATIFPARRAARLNPVDVLRFE